jgi:hypothetical protein
MPIIYPVGRDVPEGADAVYEDFAADWSYQWLLQVTPRDGKDQDEINLGPLPPREAWDLAHELDQRRPHWSYCIVPLFDPPPSATAFINTLETDQPNT